MAKALTSLHIVMQYEHSLLEVVDCCQGASATYACAAVEYYFVICRYARELLLVEEVLAPALPPVVHSHVLDYRFNDFVVLFFGCAEVRPCEVL